MQPTENTSVDSTHQKAHKHSGLIIIACKHLVGKVKWTSNLYYKPSIQP